MLITKYLDVKLNSRNTNHYEKLGYDIDNKNIKVSIHHVPSNSINKIKLKCDYCNKEFYKTIKDYHTSKNKQYLSEKDCCKDCRFIKQQEVKMYKQENNLLGINDKTYWSFKENRLYELDKYIQKYGDADNLYSSNPEGYRIWVNFKNHNHNIVEAICELGYDLNSVMKNKPQYFYDEFDNLEKEIIAFIKEYSKFPTIEEISNTIGIDYRHLSKHGGIYKIRRKMGFMDNHDLIDKNGFLNSSSYEFIVSQWLSNNEITYKREQYPFPKNEGYYRSDFTIYDKLNSPIHIEVWGMEGNKEYDKVMNKKIELYKKYNIRCVSISKKVFSHSNMNLIQDKLLQIFKPILNMKLNKIDNQEMIITNNMSDEELLIELMKHSDDSNFLPTTVVLKANKQYKLYNEVIKRYCNYHIFAEKFDKQVSKRFNYWNKENIFIIFDEFLCNNIPINIRNLSKSNYKGVIEGINSLGESLISMKLDYFSNTSNCDVLLNDYEIKFLNNVANNKGINIKNRVTEKQQEVAKFALSRFGL